MLRDYQAKMIDDLRALYASGVKRALLVGPTGCGKSTIVRYMLRDTRKRVLILTHRAEILRQLSGALSRSHGKIVPGAGLSDDLIQVGMVATVSRRLDKLPPFDFVISDEAHLSMADGWRRILERYEGVFHLGMTATPVRLDGRGLGNHYQAIVEGPKPRELVSLGWLSPLVSFAPPAPKMTFSKIGGDFNLKELEAVFNRPKITGDAIEHFKKHASQRKTLVWCCTRAHAQKVAEDFRAAGFERTTYVDGKTDSAEREKIFSDFKSGVAQVLVSVDLATTGLDVPDTSCGVMLRATESEALFIQQAGRLMRKANGKENAILLDHVGNTLRHGCADADRNWELTFDRKRTKGVTPVKMCPVCFYALPPSVQECPECGHVFAVKVIEGALSGKGELSCVDIEARRRNRAREIAQAKSFSEFRILAIKYGYKPGWAWHMWKQRKARYDAR